MLENYILIGSTIFTFSIIIPTRIQGSEPPKYDSEEPTNEEDHKTILSCIKLQLGEAKVLWFGGPNKLQVGITMLMQFTWPNKLWLRGVKLVWFNKPNKLRLRWAKLLRFGTNNKPGNKLWLGKTKLLRLRTKQTMIGRWQWFGIDNKTIRHVYKDDELVFEGAYYDSEDPRCEGIMKLLQVASIAIGTNGVMWFKVPNKRWLEGANILK